jgi:uncharacterized membrane protein affecting hemolysin expression
MLAQLHERIIGFLRQTLDPQVTALLEQMHAQPAAQPASQIPLSQQEKLLLLGGLPELV